MSLVLLQKLKRTKKEITVQKYVQEFYKCIEKIGKLGL